MFDLKPKRIFLSFLTGPLLFAAAFAHGGVPSVYETVSLSAYPAIYGEVLGKLAQGAGDSEKLAKIYTDLDKYNKLIGRVSAVLDAGGKLYAGDTEGAAVSGALTTLTELAATEAGKNLLLAAGVSSAVFTGAILTVQLWYASHVELQQSTIAVQLESLYGMLEHDPFYKTSGRRLGEGDPITVNSESIAHFWKKVILDSSWRNLFRVYVTDQLQQSWPEPSYWDRLTVSSTLLEESALEASKDELKTHIAGLLGHLNRVGKARERNTVARQIFAQFKKQFGEGNGFKDALRRYKDALGRVEEMEKFIASAPALIAKSESAKNSDGLRTIMFTARDYALHTVAAIPNKGPAGSKRSSWLDALKGIDTRCYEAWKKLQQQEQQQVIQQAAQEPVARWRASRVGFSFTWSDLENQAWTEYLHTGDVAVVRKKIQDAFTAMNKAYTAQGKKVFDEYTVLSAAEKSKLESAYRAFGRQLGDYQKADQMLNPTGDLDEALAAWKEAASAGEQMLSAAQRTLTSRIHNLQYHQLMKDYSSLKEGCLGSNGFPATGYAGFPQLKFPQPDTSGVPELVQPLQEYLHRLLRNVEKSKIIELGCGDQTVNLDTLLQTAERWASAEDMFDFLETEAEAVTLLEQDCRNQLQELLTLTDVRRKSEQEKFGALEKILNTVRGSLPEVKSVIKQAKGRLTEYVRTQSELADDIAFVKSLQRSLGSITLTLRGKRENFNNRIRTFNNWRGFLVHADAQDGDLCSVRPAFSSKKDVESELTEMNKELLDTGGWFTDKKYGTQLKKAVSDWFWNQSGLQRVKYYEYAVLPAEGGCVVVVPQLFNEMAATLKALDTEPDKLPRKLPG